MAIEEITKLVEESVTSEVLGLSSKVCKFFFTPLSAA